MLQGTDVNTLVEDPVGPLNTSSLVNIASNQVPLLPLVDIGTVVDTPDVVIDVGTSAQEGADNVTLPINNVVNEEVTPLIADVLNQEGEIAIASVADDPITSSITPDSNLVKDKKKRKHNNNTKEKKAYRIFSPLVESALWSSDEDMQDMFAANINLIPYTVVKTGCRRIRLLNSTKSQYKHTLNKFKKYLRKTAKRRHKDNPTIEQARKRPDWPLFQKAIDDELKQLVEEGVYTEVDYNTIGSSTRIIGTMMVLQVKRTPEGKIDKYKARLVALGNQQTTDQYDWIKSPTARSATVKLLISLQAKLSAKSCVMDVKGAYLKSKIDVDKEKLFVKLPNNKYALLKKYLYGLKQAGYHWSELLSLTLMKLGYKRSKFDPCLFYLHKEKNYILMATHVDDFYIVTSKKDMIYTLHKQLVREFGEVTIKDDDVLSYLGMKIDVRNDEIIVSQPGYIEKILERVGIKEDEKSTLPFADSMREAPGDNDPIDKRTYLEHIGMLNYLAVLTRPDLLYPLSRCAQRCSNPTVGDLKRVKKIFRYINYTKEYGLTFSNDKLIQLVCWVDASHGQYDDGKGHFGYSFSLSRNDGMFYCRSQKLKIVTPAGSTESEYVALYEAATEIVFLRNLLDEIGFPQNAPTVVYEDNKSAIDMALGKGSFHKQKHINIKFHYTRDLIKEKVLKLEYCRTEEMISDILTKALNGKQCEYLTSLMLNHVKKLDSRDIDNIKKRISKLRNDLNYVRR